MKRIFILCAAILMTASVFAQAPEKMSYQAVVRNGSNALVSSTAVGMKLSILQGTVSGTAVYVETQTPTTNANGLVSIEIGSGSVVSGTFATIDWANGPYFIKTETDPTGGTNYTVTGTSQLLSVPYALHAKTAESVTGTISENDPIFGASAASGITATDITNWNNKQDQLTAGTGIVISGNVISAKTYSVGDFAHGGIVFWVDETGQHGLVASKVDQDGTGGLTWSNSTALDTEAKGYGIHSGLMNTMLIIAKQGNNSANYAAGSCANYSVTEGGVLYGGWYLPSINELVKMHQNMAAINATALLNGGTAIASGPYWSSTEDNASYAFRVDFSNGDAYGHVKSNNFKVRAVRAF